MNNASFQQVTTVRYPRRMAVPVTDEMLALYKETAQKHGLSLSEWARDLMDLAALRFQARSRGAVSVDK